MKHNKVLVLTISALLLAAGALAAAAADEIAMFGGGPSRNMISEATGLPDNLDPDGPNLVWRQALGSQSYGGPVLADGIVYVGTNNEKPRDPQVTGDKGNLMAFQASDGKFLWQLVHDKLPEGRVHDWPLQGICSGPAVEGDRLWYVSNRAQVVAADVQGLKDGNDGPFTEEQYTSEGHGDILWSLDMINELDVFPHNLAAGNPLVVGDLVFTVTGNGVDEGHVNLPAPFAPSFIAVNKNTGELVWEDASPGTKILHGSWSNPSYGVAGGREQVVFPGGDGWVYSFEPKTGKLIWKFDCNPKDSKWVLGGAGTRNNIISTPVFYNDRVYVGVGQDPEHGEGPGNFWVIDATGQGDVTGKKVVWHRGGDDFHRTMSTAAIKDGIVYISDLSGFLYALDADTGEEYWQHDVFAAVWGSAFVADGKVYLGDEDGDVVILKHGKEKEVMGEFNLGNSVYTTPVAKDGVLYLNTRTELFAFKNQ
ncbi:MAG TPA: PQQ-binding-like beta-propeller repeat protein [Acidobacteriota bacterium]|nr:PQQ-binding-like beta-propeller repeat protein [Acidobacteriota bacterium]